MAKSLRLKNLAPHWGTALSAVLASMGEPHIGLSPLLWIALTPFLIVLRQQNTYKSALREGLWFSIIMTLLCFFWVASAAHEYGNLPWSLSVLLLLAFSTFNQIQMLVFPPIYVWLRKNWKKPAWTKVLAATVIYTAIDWILPKLFKDSLAHGFYNLDNIRQLASVGGVSLLTFLAFLHSEALAEFVLFRKKKHYAAFLGVIVAFWLFSIKLNSDIQTQMETETNRIQISAIQANISSKTKVIARSGVRNMDVAVIETFLDLSKKALLLSPKPDVVVWPETAYPHIFNRVPGGRVQELDQLLKNYAYESKVLLLFGGYDAEGSGNTYAEFNALFGLSPINSNIATYRKHVLLPFGEYIPFLDNYRPTLKKLFPTMGFFGRGPGPTVLESKLADGRSLRYSPVVCYEILFPDYVRPAALLGSQLIVNVTNDSWFGPFGEPQHHLALSVFRSIENRLPQLRSTNTGISGLIRQDGEILGRTGVYEEAILHEPVALLKEPYSGYLIWGEAFAALMIVASLFLIAWGCRSKRSS